MSKNDEAGVSKQVAGSLKEAIGKITGDTKTQAEGSAEKKAGTAQRNTAAEGKSKKSAH